MNLRLAGFKVSALEYENPIKSGNGFCPKLVEKIKAKTTTVQKLMFNSIAFTAAFVGF